MSFTHILVPTDFSALAQQALQYALAEARLHHARLTLLHILPHRTGTDVYYVTGTPGTQVRFDPVSGGALPTPVSSQPTVLLHDHDEEALQQLRDMMPADFADSWDVEVAIGDPAATIVRVAQEHGVDLIVMGTHGRTGLQHVLLGSVAENVIRHATCPVLTVREMVRAA